MNTGRSSKQTTCLCRDTGGKGTLPAQRTSFNTLDNWGHKTPTQSKRKRNRKEKVKGSWPETHTIHSVTRRREKRKKKKRRDRTTEATTIDVFAIFVLEKLSLVKDYKYIVFIIFGLAVLVLTCLLLAANRLFHDQKRFASLRCISVDDRKRFTQARCTSLNDQHILQT